MVKLPQRVLRRWRTLSAESYKVSIELLFTSRLEPMAATEALAQSVKRVLQEFEQLGWVRGSGFVPEVITIEAEVEHGRA